MAEYTAVGSQEVASNGAVLFTDMTVSGGCNILHRDETGVFTLIGPRTCPCRGKIVKVTVCANIGIPSTGTAGPISLAIAIDGEIDETTRMIVTPAAVEQLFNVSRTISVLVPGDTGTTISLHNASSVPITVQNATIDLVG